MERLFILFSVLMEGKRKERGIVIFVSLVKFFRLLGIFFYIRRFCVGEIVREDG